MPTVLMAATDLGAELISGVALTIVGMGIVFVALIALLLVVSGLNKLTAARPSRGAVDKPAPVAAPPAPADAHAGGIDPRVLAVISAAVTAAVGSRARVHRVRFAETSGRAAWTAQGRAGILTSHSPHLRRPARR